jgi:hypothetical protein
MRKLAFLIALLLASTAAARADTVSVFAQEDAGPITLLASGATSATFNSTFGDFSLTIGGDMTNPPGIGGLMLDGNNINIESVNGAHTITVYVTGQGFTSPTGTSLYQSSFTQNMLTGTAMSMQTLIDSGNGVHTGVLLASFTPPGSGATSTQVTLGAAGAGPYSLTDVFTFSANLATERTNATIDIAAVPGPIVGAGIPGLVAACGGLLALARRRRQLVA